MEETRPFSDGGRWVLGSVSLRLQIAKQQDELETRYLQRLKPTTAVIPSASVVLDVIGELRVLLLTDEQLTDSAVVELWFSGRLGAFLTVPSGGFLLCLSGRNLSCQTYQQILQQFVERFDNMDTNSQYAVAKNFILPFLSQPHSGVRVELSTLAAPLPVLDAMLEQKGHPSKKKLTGTRVQHKHPEGKQKTPMTPASAQGPERSLWR
ncbi:hypothetical protein EYF80_048914 [Liparis tanakae]|uniref:Uncharacterized protein n=1 Tax=Liparis tanakae TaxID=230148 RepID=A0A4Z2FKW6_9TELE|nr:hypothetical protein EYF80_048914 [Liparis tanakae]